MDCRAAEQLIQDELDGLLTPKREAELRTHLDGCPACSRARRELRRLGTATGQLDDVSLADDTWHALVSQAVAQHGRPRFHAHWRTVLGGLAAAAALVLGALWFVGTGAGRSASREPRPTWTLPPPTGDAAFSGVVARAKGSTQGAEQPGNRVAASPEHPHRSRPAPGWPLRHSPAHATAATQGVPSPPHREGEVAKSPPIRLTPNDLYIYEKALEFAEVPGSSTEPTATITAARVQAASGDIDQAIRAYEEAITESMRAPIAPRVAAADGANMEAIAVTPLPPPELIAQMSRPREPIEPYLLASLLGGE